MLSTNKSQALLEQTESLPSLLLEAIDYLRLFYQEQSLPDAQLRKRVLEIERDSPMLAPRFEIAHLLAD